MKKSILALLCLTMLCATLSGCAARNANALSATNAPAATFTPMTATNAPMDTIAPTTSMNPSDDVTLGNNGAADNTVNSAATGMTPAESSRLAERISEAIERISEVDDAEVIVDNERVLVAVEFEDQYSAGVDERMRELITKTVREVDESLTDVQIQITDDTTLYGQVKSLAERVGKATGLDELADDIGDLWDRIIGKTPA